MIRIALGAHSLVGWNKSVRATVKTGVSDKHTILIAPETPPRATRLDGLIPAYVLLPLDVFVLFCAFRGKN
ncbi:MAG TPA: hypothetical protein VIE65_05750 [Methylobacter sp.]